MVSVIIPTYNRAAFLKEAVNSVLAQSYRNFELIVVDDGSTDNTAEYLASHGIKHITLPHSGMPGKARNAGALAAEGTYLAFLDSDDLWAPEKLALQKQYFIDNPDFRLCHTREIWNREGKIISQAGQRHRRQGDIFADALEKCIIGPSTVMMEKSLFLEAGLFAEDIEIAEDYEFWLRITAYHQAGYIDRPLITKRGGHEDQLSGKYGHIEYFRIRALERNIPALPFHRKIPALEVLLKKLSIYARGCFKRNKIQEGNNILENIKRYSDILNSTQGQVNPPE